MSLLALPVLRILSGDKVIQSRTLNRFGVQVGRTVAAHCLYNLRGAAVNSLVQEKFVELQRDGMMLWQDFLPSEQFGMLRTEALELLTKYPDKPTVLHHGPNTLEVGGIREFGFDVLPQIRQYMADTRLIALFSAAEKRRTEKLHENCWVERLTQGPLDDRLDPETDLHSDIFFNTHKAWLYLDDVTLDHGPFVFVKGSHHITKKQLGYIYRESCTANKGSRRITPEELTNLGLKETVITCPRNTLVMANTFGYHRRLRGTPGFQRHGIHISLRANPFRFWR